MQGQKIQIGESFVGEGAEAAHINTVLGYREGPVGTAWAMALATPRAGHVAFVAVLRPNLPVKPLTLFVNKAPIEGDLHADLTWGAAQAGVAGGVADAVADGVITAVDADQMVLIAAVWVNPKATDPDLVYSNNRAAAHAALANGRNGTPSVDETLAAREHPCNPFFPGGRPPGDPPSGGNLPPGAPLGGIASPRDLSSGPRSAPRDSSWGASEDH